MCTTPQKHTHWLNSLFTPFVCHLPRSQMLPAIPFQPGSCQNPKSVLQVPCRVGSCSYLFSPFCMFEVLFNCIQDENTPWPNTLPQRWVQSLSFLSTNKREWMISRLVFLWKSMTKLPPTHDGNWRLSACIPPQKMHHFWPSKLLWWRMNPPPGCHQCEEGSCDVTDTPQPCREKHGWQLWPAAASVPPRHLDPRLQRDPSQNRGLGGLSYRLPSSWPTLTSYLQILNFTVTSRTITKSFFFVTNLQYFYYHIE